MSVTQALKIYTEPLDITELSFLHDKAGKEKKQYYKVYSMLMVLSFIIPFAGAWYRATDGSPNAFSPLKFFTTASILLGISTAGTWLSYRISLRKVRLDLMERVKVIEVNHITRKQYMPQTNTYYFYIESPTRLSIEVTQADFYRLHEGDEVSIEYAMHSKLYLGYF